MNTITITGNAGRDAETRTTTGKRVASVSIGYSQGRDKPTIWLTVDAWEPSWAFDRLAGVRKGQPIAVVGRLTMREHEQRQFWGVVAQDVELTTRADAPQREQAPPATRRDPGDPRDPDDYDQIPF